MPSNQPPRPLTRPHSRVKSGGQPFLVSASPYVQRANRFLTFFSTCFLAFTFLFTLRSANEIESYARGGTEKLGKYAGSHWPGSHAKCNPFRSPGWLERGTAATQLPVWRTFSRDCPGVNAMTVLSNSEAAAATLPALAPLRNQTILVISDATPYQKRLSELCGVIAGGRLGRVDVSHPWGGILQDHKAQDPQGHGLGTYCYVPSIDLLIHHFPQGALVSTDTVSSETRLINFLPHLLNSWSSPTLSAPSLPPPRKTLTPPLTIWGSSYEADLQAWQKSFVNGELVHNEETLNHWRARNLQALTVLDGVLSDASRGRSLESPTIQWQSPGFGDVTKPVSHQTGVSSAANLDPSSTIPDSHMATAPLYSAILSLLDKKTRSSSDPFFEQKAHNVPANVKTEFEWWRVSQGIHDERAAVGVWGEMLLASLAEVL